MKNRSESSRKLRGLFKCKPWRATRSARESSHGRSLRPCSLVAVVEAEVDVFLQFIQGDSMITNGAFSSQCVVGSGLLLEKVGYFLLRM